MSGFRFIDDVDAQRQLGVDRVTFERLVREGRLKPVSVSGENHAFFRAADIARVREALAAEAVAPPTPATSEAPAKGKKKAHDPAMKVHLRLQADLKWYDLSDADLDAWFAQLRPDGYERNRMNIQHTMQRLEYLLQRIEEGERLLGDS